MDKDMSENENKMPSARYKLIKFLAKNDDIFFTIRYLRLRFRMFAYKNVADEAYIKRQYHQRTGKKLNLDNPILYNEKVQYSKLYYHDSRLKKLVDKAEVRDYVAEVIGEKHLTRLIGIFDSVEEIPFDRLPERFVMKLTNGSGFNYVCNHKTAEDIKKIKKRFRQWLKIDFFMLGREWAYKGMKNRILCEEYLESDTSSGLNDYKVFCFDGVPKLIQVDFARFTNHRRNLYTTNWEFLNERVAYENDPNANLPKPAVFDEMLECAKRLSKGFPQVRVDFYCIGNRLVFGEMTFYHGAGYLHFEHEEFEKQLGSYWKIG